MTVVRKPTFCRVQRSDPPLTPGRVAMTPGRRQAAGAGLPVAQRTTGLNRKLLLPSCPGVFEPVRDPSHRTGIPVAVDLALPPDARVQPSAAAVQ